MKKSPFSAHKELAQSLFRVKVPQSLSKCQPRTFADFFGSGKPGIRPL